MDAMRVLLVLAVLVANAWADKRLVDMTPRFKRELAACEMQEGGIALMITRTRVVIAQNPPDKAELDADVDRLGKGHAVLDAYCAETRAMVKFLEDHASSPYKSVRKELAARDAAVRKLRRDAKVEVEALAPITRKLIPRVNARTPAPPEDRKPTGKFPSGRVVELPALTGAWKLGGTPVMDIAEYTTPGVKAVVTAYPFTSGSCEQQRAQFTAKAGDEPVTDLELSPAAKELGIAWAARYVRRDQIPHVLTKMCVPTANGGVVAVADLTPHDQTALDDALAELLVAMLAAQLPKPAP